MKISQAIKEAMKTFEREKKQAEIRNIYLLEWTGSKNKYDNLRIKIEYTINDNYEESDTSPYIVIVYHDLDKEIISMKERWWEKQ